MVRGPEGDLSTTPLLAPAVDWTAAPPLEQARAFLRAWCRPETFGSDFIEIATVRPLVLPFCASVQDAVRVALAQDARGRLNVYFGLHPRRRASGSGKLDTATNEDVTGLAGLALDLDVHGKGAHFKTIDEAMRALEDRLPPELQPPLLFASGHGVWGLWPFRERLALSEYPRYQDVGRRLAALHGGDPSIYDLRRIARVPGTRNWRNPAHPVRAQLLRCDDSRHFALDDLEDWLPALPAPPAGATRARSKGVTTTIARTRPGPPPTTLPAPVLRVLDALALPTRTLFDPKTGGVLCVQILAACPACRAGHEHKAWLTPSGRLKCWRESCPAGIDATGMDAGGHAVGLPLATWVGAHAPAALPALSRATPPAAPVERCADLAEAESRLPALVDEIIDWAQAEPGRVALLAANPGVGKTREILRALASKAGRGTLLAHSHARLDEREHESDAHGPKRRRRYQGLLSVLDDKGRPVCRYAGALATWAERGWSIRATACRTCAHRESYAGTGETCRAYEGVTGKGTRFATHAHAASLGPTGRLLGPIIADELPALLDVVPLSARELVPLTAVHVDPELTAWAAPRAPLARIVIRAATELREKRKATARPGHPWRISGEELRNWLCLAAALEAGGGTLPMFGAKDGIEALDEAIAKVERAHDAAPHPPPPEGPSLRDARIRAEHYPHHAIDGALLALAREGVVAPAPGLTACLVADGVGDRAEVSIEWRTLGFGTWTDKDGQPLSLVVLDASAPHMEHSIRAALPDREVRMFRLDVKDPDAVERVFMTTTTLTRRSLFETRRPFKLRERAGPAVARILRVTGRKLATSGLAEPYLGIITHAPLGRILAHCVRVLDEDDKSARERLGEADALGVLAELEALRASHRMGKLKVLWYGGQRGSNELESCDALLCLGDPWPDIGAGEEDARALGVGSAVHLEGLVGAEVLQALGRARAVRRNPEHPVVLLYAGGVPPGCWAVGTFEVLPLGGGPSRSEASMDAEDLARAMASRWGAACPALARLAASAPSIVEVLDHRAATAISRSPISTCHPMPPLDLGAIDGLPLETLRDAFQRALGGLDEVTVPSPTAPAGAGRAWRLREARPGAAREICDALRAWLAGAEPVAPATETAAPAEEPVVSSSPEPLVAPRLPPSPRCAPRPSRTAAYCAVRARRRAVVPRLISPPWYQQAASRYRRWHRGADGREKGRPLWLRRSVRPRQPDPAPPDTKVTGK